MRRNKVVIDLSKHSDIMEDAIDRIRLKDAANDERIPWEEATKILDKKHGLDVPGNNKKKSSKVSRNRTKKRLS